MSKTIEPSWDLYGAFLAVMQTGSLSGASRALRVAQPTARRQIEALEEALGVVLFTRAPNGLTPTDAARTTLPHAEAIAASARALVRSLLRAGRRRSRHGAGHLQRDRGRRGLAADAHAAAARAPCGSQSS